MIGLDGKKIVSIGFVLFFMAQILAVLDIIFSLRMSIGWLINMASMLIICMGFGLNWLSNGNGLDFISAGTAFFMVLIFLMKRVSKSGNFQEFLASATCIIYFLMAIRAFLVNKTGYNKLFAIMLGLAGLYNIISLDVVGWFWRLTGSINFGVLVMNVGFAICSGICLLECFQETY